MGLLPASAYDFEVDGIWYNIISDGVEVTYGARRYEGHIVIPSTVSYNGVEYAVKSIGERAFNAASFLTSVTLPEGLTSIGNYAFQWSGITSLTIPESVTSIDEGAFSDCNVLTSVNIPKNITSIGKRVFYSCRALPSVTLPEGLTSIGDNAFQCCYALTSLTFPESVTSIGEFAFSLCTTLTSLTLPEGLTSISDGTFDSCFSLTSVSLPEGLKSIGNYAFNLCSSLTSVTLPESVTSIGEHVFWFCSVLSTVYNYNKTPQIINSNCFEGTSAYLVIYVPKGCLDAYENAEGWRDFTIKEMDTPEPPSGNDSPEIPELRVYSVGPVLHIDGYNGVDNVVVYSEDGKLLFNGFAREIPLQVDNQTIILSVGDKIFKLFVR